MYEDFKEKIERKRKRKAEADLIEQRHIEEEAKSHCTLGIEALYRRFQELVRAMYYKSLIEIDRKHQVKMLKDKENGRR